LATSGAYTQGYNSFSGVDMKVVMGSEAVGTVQGISYSITREKAPIYTMGSADPRSFSRGKRGIAGTLIFIVFDRHAILSTLGGLAPTGGLLFQSDIDDIHPDFQIVSTGDLDKAQDVLGSTSGVTPADTVDNQESNISQVGADQELASAWYADQIPPFDISIAAANEYGHLMVMRIYGAECLNEGSGVSIDDIVTEQQHTFVARQVVPWQSVPSANAQTIARQGNS